MSIHHRSDDVLLWHGDCLELLKEVPDASIDAVVTDPPYALEFMGKTWDRFDKGDAPGSFQHWCELWAAECLRVLKPGGHLLAFGGTRTFHRLAAGTEDAGFEIRDSIAWLYGSGFPKSLDVSKAIDKMAGVERETIGDKLDRPGYHLHGHNSGTGAFGKGLSSTTPETRLAAALITAPATSDAQKWAGWGTALKPAFEPVVVARKPLVGTVAANVLQHGTGALNIDGTRIDGNPRTTHKDGNFRTRNAGPTMNEGFGVGAYSSPDGRWPANVVLDESQAAALDEQSGTLTSGGGDRGSSSRSGGMMGKPTQDRKTHYVRDSDSGGASRFFYVAKASAKERPKVDGSDAHPTVKPLALMQWLIRLVTPPGGVVLDPFAGSGTTVEAALREGVRCMAMEREADYLPLIMHRIERHQAKE